MAAWFGMVTGLVEGAALMLFQHLGWLNWFTSQMRVWWEIIWVSAFFDLFLFLLAGIALTVVARFLPRAWALRLCAFSLSFLMFLDWLLISGRIRYSGCLVLAVGLATVATRWIYGHAGSALRMWRRSFPAVAAAVVLVFVIMQGGGWLVERISVARLPAPAPDAPNILVIVVDTLRADHLSSYGYARQTSPRVDRLAQQGVLFEQAISTTSWTLPSHASLLTGRFPFEHGAENESYDGRFPTIGEALQQHGYRTAAFSANTVYFSRSNGFGRGFSRFEDCFQNLTDMLVRTVYGRRFFTIVMKRRSEEDIRGRKLAYDVDHEFLRWLGRASNRPFFAFLNYFDVHDPYFPPPPFRSRFSKVPRPGGRINSYVFRHDPKLTPEQMQEELDAYDGAIAYVDDAVGRLLDELDRRGLAGNTIVVFTSDHGEAFGEHGQMTHRNALYRPLVHVPLVIRWPGKIPAALRVAGPVTNAWLPATLMDLLGANPSPFPTPSLAQAWKDPSMLGGDHLPFAELRKFPYKGMEDTRAYYGAMQSAVTRQWQYIRHESFGEELYDWEKDPQELHNLANTPEGQAAAREIVSRLERMKVPKLKVPATNAQAAPR
ncbi:MAG TPA: sulfatase [Candidatus Acidoferrales bacterium]|nr:sulfatase [Candidatus Acidoferrales bacterium]